MKKVKINYDPLFVTLAKKKWTSRKLAEETGISPAIISKIKQGKGDITGETLMRIKLILEVSLEEICELVEEE